MSFAELDSHMASVLFSDAGFGESATYTAPTDGAEAVPDVRAMIDEPTEPPFPRELQRSAFRERCSSLWIWRFTSAGAALSPAKDGTVVVTTSHGVVRTFTLVSLQQQDPDRCQWAVREVTA